MAAETEDQNGKSQIEDLAAEDRPAVLFNARALMASDTPRHLFPLWNRYKSCIRSIGQTYVVARRTHPHSYQTTMATNRTYRVTYPSSGKAQSSGLAAEHSHSSAPGM
jgi:hypothetical protein